MGDRGRKMVQLALDGINKTCITRDEILNKKEINAKISHVDRSAEDTVNFNFNVNDLEVDVLYETDLPIQREKNYNSELQEINKIEHHFEKMIFVDALELAEFNNSNDKIIVSIDGQGQKGSNISINQDDNGNHTLVTNENKIVEVCEADEVVQANYEMYNEEINNNNYSQTKRSKRKPAIEGKVHLFTMDMEAVKLSPDINASAIYYKQRLQVHNFTIYNLASHQCTNYWWNETESDLSAPSFVTCIIAHLTKYCLSDSLPITIFSDGCGYQNRNNILSNALLNFSVRHNKIIEQKYLEKGHTQMECDSVHAKIETRLKSRSIFVPYDYVGITLDARKNVSVDGVRKKLPYDVEYLTHAFFKNYADPKLLRCASIRPGHSKNDPTVSQIRVLKYLPSAKVQYKIDFDEEFEDLPQRYKEIDNFYEAKPLHECKLKISKSKWTHLQNLKSVIPQEYHSFYNNLEHTNK